MCRKASGFESRLPHSFVAKICGDSNSSLMGTPWAGPSKPHRPGARKPYRIEHAQTPSMSRPTRCGDLRPHSDSIPDSREPSAIAGPAICFHLGKSPVQDFLYQCDWQVGVWPEVESCSRSPNVGSLEFILHGDRYCFAHGMQAAVALGDRQSDEVPFETEDWYLVADTFSAVGRCRLDDDSQLL